jgi:ABC-type maltose transport system permease subunit
MAFVLAWDDYVLALQLMTSDEKRTLPVGVVGTFVGALGVRWGDMMAASVLMATPVIILFFFLQRRLVEGLTAGAVKG